MISSGVWRYSFLSLGVEFARTKALYDSEKSERMPDTSQSSPRLDYE